MKSNFSHGASSSVMKRLKITCCHAHFIKGHENTWNIQANKSLYFGMVSCVADCGLISIVMTSLVQSHGSIFRNIIPLYDELWLRSDLLTTNRKYMFCASVQPYALGDTGQQGLQLHKVPGLPESSRPHKCTLREFADITVKSHELYGVLNHRQLHCLCNSLLRIR